MPVYGVDQLKGLVTGSFGMARRNQFMIQMPSVQGGAISSSDINLLCKNVSLPGVQNMTLERLHGFYREKIAYAPVFPDVTMTFYVLNDYSIRKYFEEWRKLIWNYQSEAGYKGYYASANIKIHQLKRPQIGFNVGLGAFSIVGAAGLDEKVYSCGLVEAFPTSIGQIDLSNDQDGLVELTITFSYSYWESFDAKDNLISGALNF